MRSIIIYLFLSWAVGIYSCTQRKHINEIPIIDIEDNIKNMEKIFISQFSEDIRYIPLSIDTAYPLYWTTHLYVDFSKDFILDSDGRTCILYDAKGHFIRQIGRQGRGPGEYLGIKYVKLINDGIVVYDYVSDDLIKYKMDGSFVQRYTSGLTGNKQYRFIDGFFLDDSLILGNIENFTGTDEYKALIIDYHGNIIRYFRNYIFFSLESGLHHAQSPGSAIYYRFGNKTFFKEFLNDTLFQLIDKYELTPSYIFDFGKFKEPLSVRGKDWNKIDLSTYINIYRICQTENFIILNCGFGKYFPAKRLTPEIISLPGTKDYTQWYNTTGVIGVYDKDSRELVFSTPSSTNNHLSTSGLYNDIDGGPRFMPLGMVNDSTMVMKIRFDYLVEHIASEEFNKSQPKYPEKKKKLELFVDSLKNADFDNPVYMFVTFKKNI